MLRSLLLFSIAVQIFSFDTWGGKRECSESDAQAGENTQFISSASAPPYLQNNSLELIAVAPGGESLAHTDISLQPPSYKDNKKFFQGARLAMVKQPERARFLYCGGQKAALRYTTQEIDDLSKKILGYQTQIQETKKKLKENEDQLAHLSRSVDSQNLSSLKSC